MLNVDYRTEDGVRIISLDGELDTLTSQDLEKQLDELLADTDTVVVDMEKVGYITSAGLRILLQMEKVMEQKGSMKVIHVSEDIMEIFEVTGFTEILTIE